MIQMYDSIYILWTFLAFSDFKLKKYAFSLFLRNAFVILQGCVMVSIVMSDIRESKEEDMSRILCHLMFVYILRAG